MLDVVVVVVAVDVVVVSSVAPVTVGLVVVVVVPRVAPVDLHCVSGGGLVLGFVPSEVQQFFCVFGWPHFCRVRGCRCCSRCGQNGPGLSVTFPILSYLLHC